jgi:hypothetical protein
MKLTHIFDPVVEIGWQSTPRGMAHWAGTGPPGATCQFCTHFQADKRGRHGYCQKYRELMCGRVKKPVKFARDTKACHYYGYKQETG